MSVKSLGERLRRARYRSGLSLRELSDVTGITMEMLWRYEHAGSDMRSQNLKRLCKALGVSSDWLLFGDHPPVEGTTSVPPS
jgi:transcriptional regulator with XRE-family HTH domain